MLDLIDSHSHIDVAQFDSDRAAVIDRARAAGVRAQVVPAIALAGFENLRQLCIASPGLHAAYGLHPGFLSAHRIDHVAALREWLERERASCVAVGECGLDVQVDTIDLDLQRNYFDAQIKLARDFDLPLVIHARGAVEEVILRLRRYAPVRGVVHSFSGSTGQALQLWKMGFCIGIGGPITYARALRLRQTVTSMPIDFLLLETDSPDQPLHGRQGLRNEPAYLTEICLCIAQLRAVSPSEIAQATTRNAERIFALPHAYDPKSAN